MHAHIESTVAQAAKLGAVSQGDRHTPWNALGMQDRILHCKPLTRSERPRPVACRLDRFLNESHYPLIKNLNDLRSHIT